MSYRNDLIHRTIFILVLLCVFFATAQESNINKLLNELKQDAPDTTQLRIYAELSSAYTTVDPEKKFFYANKYRIIAHKLGIDSLVAHGYLDMGTSYGIRNQTDSALFYFAKGYKVAKKANFKSGMARALGSIGYAYDRLDNKEEAVKNILQSLELFKQIKQDKGISQSYVNLGSLYFDMGQYTVAESYFKLALQKNTETNDRRGISHSNFTLGNTYKELKQLREAREHYGTSLEMSQELENASGEALARWGIGQVDVLEGKYDQALEQFEIALKINRSIQNEYNKGAVLISIAEVYIKKKDYKKAERYAAEVYKSGKETNFLVVLSKALPLMIEINKKQQRFESALEYQTELMQVIDDLESEKTTKNVVLVDFDRVRTENSNLKEDNTKIAARNTSYAKAILATSVLLLLVIVLLVLYYMRNQEKKATNRLLQSQKEEIASQNKELEQLNRVKNKFFSIVSHDLRSPIASLRMLFGLYRQGELSESELNELLLKLEDTVYTTAVFLDNLLEWSKSQLDGMVVKPASFQVRQLVDANIRLLHSPIQVKELQVTVEVDPSVMAFGDPNMINVALRNLVSNAVKFCKPGDAIGIRAERKEDRIVIDIMDTGPGIAPEELEGLFSLEFTVSKNRTEEKGHQVGLVLCKDMIELNNGQITVESRLGEGTTFRIVLPVGI